MTRKMNMLRYFAGASAVILLAGVSIAQGPADIKADADLETARQVKDYYADWLSSIPGVSRVEVAGSEQGQPEIKVDVEQMTSQIKEIPAKLNGIPVVIAP